MVVNGSPFRFGEAMLSYRPLYSVSTDTSKSIFPFFSGGQIAGDVTSIYPTQDYTATKDDKSTLMARSQRMNIKIQPHTSSGGEMTLPFIYYKDALDLSNPTLSNSRMEAVFKEMGTLTLESVTHLRSTAAANSDGVGISLFVWAENVELWGPTKITIQASKQSDEFDEVMKPSGIASTVADAAGTLAKIPTIAPYALATQVAAGKLSGLMKYFGWSNPPVLHPVQAKLPKASFLNPNPLGSYPDEVLALDPKNELTVDPRSVGSAAIDELDISRFCSRMAIVDVIDWRTSFRNGSLIAEFPVHPIYYRAEMRDRTYPKLDTVRVSMIPACYASQMFEYWRGTMVLKVRVVSSQFHRGRLSVSWDPAMSYSGSSRKEAANITHIIDLATATEMVVKIPYMSHLGMLRVSDKPVNCKTQADVDFKLWGVGAASSYTTFDWGESQLFDHINGVVQVHVINGLQVGDATADVPVVFEIGFEDMTFMCPRVEGQTLDSWYVQPAGFAAASMTDIVVQGLEAPGVSESEQTVSVDSDFKHLTKLYGGEALTSFRPLLHRTYPYKTKSKTVPTTNKITFISLTVPRFPLPPHTKVNAYLDKIPVGSTSNNTNVQVLNPISYLTPCFTGYRGSMVWKAQAGGNARSIMMHKSSSNFATAVLDFDANTPAEGFDNAYQGILASGLNGIAWSSKYLANTVSASFPQYNNLRMMPADPITMYRKPSSVTMPDVFDNDGVRVVCVNDATTDLISTIHLSVAAGTDFNMFHFVNVPDIYIRA